MTKSKQVKQSEAKPLETGQLWRVEDWNLQITHVGKRLVHYQRTRGGVKRTPVSMSAKSALERYLKDHGAILVDPEKS